MEQHDKIAVLDFGGQYAHLIAKRIRDLGVYSEILLPEANSNTLRKYKGLILSGGPKDLNSKDAPTHNPDLFELGIPILGICYGHQLMAMHFGGKTHWGERREDGSADIELKSKTGIFQGFEDADNVWMSHGVEVSDAPKGFCITASTSYCNVAAMANIEKNLFGIQFHAEVSHTKNGSKIFDNFINITGVKRTWNTKDTKQKLINKIKAEVGDRNVFILVSGGIDSNVSFILLNEALGEDRVYGLHIDTGFMRKNESHKVQVALQEIQLHNFHIVDASHDFLEAVQGISDPEEKRHAIGKTFLEVQARELKALGLDPKKWMLGQGTLYPDTIESGGTKHADTIKTHHNRVPEIDTLIEQGLVVEPVVDLYKDEVRALGKELGLPKELVWRHTFPGPGLAVQSLCSDGIPLTQDYNNSVAMELASEAGYSQKILPVRSVGVQGDERSYTHVCAVYGEADWTKLASLSRKITNQSKNINRVVYSLTSTPQDEFTLKKAFLTKDRLDIHREADDRANTILRKYNLYLDLYEFPVIMIPIGTNGGESIVLRPLYSENVMTVEFAKLPFDVVKEMARDILALDGIDAVFYDVTDKPPGTVQWE